MLHLLGHLLGIDTLLKLRGYEAELHIEYGFPNYTAIYYRCIQCKRPIGTARG